MIPHNSVHTPTTYRYVTFQVVCSTSFTLDVAFPAIFARYLEFLNVLSFDVFGAIRWGILVKVLI